MKPIEYMKGTEFTQHGLGLMWKDGVIGIVTPAGETFMIREQGIQGRAERFTLRKQLGDGTEGGVTTTVNEEPDNLTFLMRDEMENPILDPGDPPRATTTERLSDRMREPDAATERNMLLAQTNATQKLLAKREKELKEAMKQLSTSEADLLEAGGEHNEMAAEIMRLKDELETAGRTCAALADQRDELAKDLAATTTARDEMIQEAILARMQRDEVARDLMLQTKEMDEARAKWIEVGKQRDALMCTGGEMADMRKERDELRKRLQSKSGLGQAFEAVAKSEGELKDKNATQAEEIMRLTMRCVELHNPKLVAEMNVKLQATKLERDKLAHELSHLRTSLAEETERRMRTEGTIADLQEESARMKQGMRELKKTEDALSERAALTSKDLAMWRERSRAAESAVTDLDAETVRLKQELRETREELEKKKKFLFASDSAVKAYEKTEAQLRMDLDKARWEQRRTQDALDLQTKRVEELETNPVPDPEPVTHGDLILRTGSLLAAAATKLMEASTMWAKRARDL